MVQGNSWFNDGIHDVEMLRPISWPIGRSPS